MEEKFDFCGWATKNNLKCSDGRIIRKDAFKHCDGKSVPLVWNHDHTDPYRVVGHAILENRDEGVYTYGVFNDTDLGKTAKIYVQHGDINQLSIYANQLQQQGPNVMHGNIREVSLVLAGANPGACIESVMVHGEESDEEAVIYTGEDISLYHAEEEKKEDMSNEEKPQEENRGSEKTIKEVFDELTDEQKTLVYAMVGMALDNDGEDDEDEEDDEDYKGGNKSMKHNVFDQDETQENVLSHDAMQTIIGDAKRYGSMKESFIAHADEYGITNIDYLFPEAKTMDATPEFIKRDTGWVQQVMGAVHHTPFSRIKSVFADITEDEARARGYIKGKLKKEEVFSLLKRTTTPTTIYKKQKMDRDDVIDITDFDVIAWLKSEMRMMLDEEIARAILVGDGRLSSSDDKINESNIRPIWTDADLYTIKSLITVPAGGNEAEEFLDQAVRAMKDYKGSGSPVAYMTEDMLTECLLLKDTNKHRLYKDASEVATAMRVSRIVTVPVMEGLKRTSGSDTFNLKALIVNLNDYNVGADKGGAINMFDDFDIDYNQQKYLIETRCSGALTKPYSAIALETKTTAAAG